MRAVPTATARNEIAAGPNNDEEWHVRPNAPFARTVATDADADAATVSATATATVAVAVTDPVAAAF